MARKGEAGALHLSGLLMFLATSQFLIMLVISSSLYPGYSISGNFISDLGATCREGVCRVFQPSSAIFNTSSILMGILLAAGALNMLRIPGDRIFPALLLTAGLGAAGVGVFPESAGILHTISALIAFLFGGLAILASYRILGGWARIAAPAMGALALASLALFITGAHLGLGPGGIERILAYSELLPGCMIGGYLMGAGNPLASRHS